MVEDDLGVLRLEEVDEKGLRRLEDGVALDLYLDGLDRRSAGAKHERAAGVEIVCSLGVDVVADDEDRGAVIRVDILGEGLAILG